MNDKRPLFDSKLDAVLALINLGLLIFVTVICWRILAQGNPWYFNVLLFLMWAGAARLMLPRINP